MFGGWMAMAGNTMPSLNESDLEMEPAEEIEAALAKKNAEEEGKKMKITEAKLHEMEK